ncbi:hypothetical protein FRB99_008074 [Tulasnella sp. 403]|nr:hypothetical protein FRB99_008074 [Tulasnella sp. 403]
MDPRMDSGLMPVDDPDPNAPPRPPPFDAQTPLTAEEISWVLDRALAAEMDWHSGRFMANTIHTLEYVHHLADMSYSYPIPQSEADKRIRPKELIPTVLRPCVIGLLKTCDLVWRQFSQPSYLYDGEDYHSEKFDVSLCETVQTPRVIEMLDSAESWLLASPGQCYFASKVVQTGTQFELELPNRDMLLLRVQLRRSILRAFAQQADASGAGQATCFRDARLLLDAILAIPAPAEPEPTSPARSAFDPAVSRRLVVVTPLKPLPLSSQQEAWATLRGILDCMVTLFDVAGRGTAIEWMMLLLLQARSVPPRTAIVRSMTVTVIRSRSAKWIMELPFMQAAYVPLDSLALLTSSYDQNPYENTILAVGQPRLPITDIESRLQEVLEHFFLTLNQNRPRARRNFAKVLFAWHKIEEDMAKVLAPIRNSLSHMQSVVRITQRAPLVIHFLRFTIIVEYILSGFELDLYTPSEFPFIYWYTTGICGSLITTLEELKKLEHSNDYRFAPPVSSPDNPGTTQQDRMAWIDSQVMWYEALRGMCMARFVALVPLVDTPSLFPQLDLERQRMNVHKRFEWTVPPPHEKTDLTDMARPDWDAYVMNVARLQAKKAEDLRTRQMNLLSSAKETLINLRGRAGASSATGLCEGLWVDSCTSLIRSCTKALRMYRPRASTVEATDDDAADDGWAHPWFPDIDIQEQ